MSYRRDSRICSVDKTFAVSRLRLEPPSTSIFVTRKLWMTGDTICGRAPTPATLDGWSVVSKLMTCPDHSRGLGGVEMTAFSS